MRFHVPHTLSVALPILCIRLSLRHCSLDNFLKGIGFLRVGRETDTLAGQETDTLFGQLGTARRQQVLESRTKRAKDARRKPQGNSQCAYFSV